MPGFQGPSSNKRWKCLLEVLWYILLSQLGRWSCPQGTVDTSVILVMIFQLQLSYSFDFLVIVIVLVNYKGIF